MIMIRTLRRDISQYNQLETAEEAQEETVRTLLHRAGCASGSPTVRVAPLLIIYLPGAPASAGVPLRCLSTAFIEVSALSPHPAG